MGLLAAAAILLANFSRSRATDGITWLLALAIPTLVAGQLWVVAIIVARGNRVEGWRPSWYRRSTGWTGTAWGNPRRLFFEGLGGWLVIAVLAMFVASWEIGSKALPAIDSGTPAPPTRQCPYRLTEGGNYTCVSRAKFIAADAGEQRFVTAVFAGFYTIQLAITAGELRRRRAVGSQALA